MQRGESIPPKIRQFIVETKSNAPRLTYAQVASMVESEYGVTIDRSSVGRIWLRSKAESPLDGEPFALEAHRETMRRLARRWLDELKAANPVGESLEQLSKGLRWSCSPEGLLDLAKRATTHAATALETSAIPAGESGVTVTVRRTQAEDDVLFPRLLEHIAQDQAFRLYEQMMSQQAQLLSFTHNTLGTLAGMMAKLVTHCMEPDVAWESLRSDALVRERVASLLWPAFNVVVSDVLTLLCTDVAPDHRLLRYAHAIELYGTTFEHELQLQYSLQPRDVIAAKASSIPDGTSFNFEQFRTLLRRAWTTARPDSRHLAGVSEPMLGERAGLPIDMGMWNEWWHDFRARAMRAADIWQLCEASRDQVQRRLAEILEEQPFPGKCGLCSEHALLD